MYSAINSATNSAINATNVGMVPRKAAKPENMGKRFVGAITEKTGKW